jgi:hypothetical protein
VLSALLVSERPTVSLPQRHLKAWVAFAPQIDWVPQTHLLPETVELLVVKTPAPQTLSVPQTHLVPASADALELV